MAAPAATGSDIKEVVLERQARRHKLALQPLKDALESHRRSLKELERVLIEFEENLDAQERREEPQEQEGQQGAG